VIVYTTDGSTPTEVGGVITNGTVYSTPVPILTANVTLSALAYGGGYVDSPVMIGVYAITNPPPSAPVFSPTGGTYTSAQSVTITSDGATTIYYTIDGSTPTISSPLYTAPVLVANNTILQAMGVNNGGNSLITSASFTILPPAPVFSLAPGTYPNGTPQSVTISDVAGATIYYTTDGTTPTTASLQYSTVISLPIGTTTLSALAVTVNGSSAIATGTYILTPLTPQIPVFSPAGGPYTSAQSVTITSVGATAIYYTTDGSTPTIASTLYAAAVPIDNSTVLQALAVNDGGPSPIATASFTFLSPAPVFNPTPGTYTNITMQSVTISDVASATIYYTTDGTTPTTASTQYTSAISLPIGTTTLQAIAVESGFPASAVTSGLYTIINVPQVAAPVFSPVIGTSTVTITSATSGAVIRYTTDGSTPTETNGTVYSGSVSISPPTTLQAIAYEASYTDSPVTSATIGTPTITITSPANGSTIGN
jgi:hypothetical protein